MKTFLTGLLFTAAVFGASAQAEGSVGAVQSKRNGAGEFGESAGGGAAHQLHLEHAVAGVHVAEGSRGVGLGGGVDPGDAVGIEFDGDGLGEAGKLDLVVTRGRRPPEREPGERQEEHDADEEAEQDPPGPPE